ncbi:pentapeptide repeat-containing protein [Pseudanabaena sp. UWO311]|uniref:pentapeptide repeat-containing protein n=1 Tax=Pseudanabaena sp. UWO311 TaxID=2487337 RepID=UPI00115A3668|nr:pentapeptide repeat-containing protein [Pseudanabaena sp. UWO311]TYQ25891.1 pentapeptide repeat-containing protein [Pseudanabaena sp. UWO311]
MDNYVNYRYRDFQNQSFQNEFPKGEEKKADFTGSRLKSCDFRGTNLAGADFSETAIGQDKQNFQKQIMQMSLHIILGLPLGLLSWFSGRLVLVGCGGEVANPYGWMTNPFVWMFAFATAAAMSQRKLFIIYMGLIGLMVIASIHYIAMTVIGIGVMVAAFIMSLCGLYLGYKKGAITVGMVWMAVGVSSAISAGYSWVKYREIHYAILFAILAIVPAILATKAFNLHFAKVKMSAMTSFYGADLENARFVNADLANCDFLGANLQGVDWHGATFKNCKFPKGFSMDVNEAIAKHSEINPEIEQLAVNS